MKGSLIQNKSKILNAFWAVLAKFLSGSKLVIVGVIIARFLGPDDFGSYSYTISFVMLFSVLSEFRMHNILIRDISEGKNTDDIILGSAFMSSIAFSILGYFLLLLVMFSIEKNQNLQTLIIVYGAVYFFQTIRFIRAFFISKFKNTIIFKIEIIAGLSTIILTLIIAYFSPTILSFLLLRMFDVFFISLLLFLFYQLGYGNIKFWRFKKNVAKSIIISSSPLVLSSLALVIFQHFDQIMIKHFMDEFSVGQYSAAVSIISLIVFVPVVLTEVTSPSLISYKNTHSRDDYLNKLQLFSDSILWSAVLLCILVTIFSPFIIDLIYGDEFNESIQILKIFTWQSIFIALGAVASQIMIIDNTHQIAYFKSLLGGATNILLNLYWIPEYGIVGAVYASLIAYAISSLFAHLFIKRYRYIFSIQLKSIFFGIPNIYKNLSRKSNV